MIESLILNQALDALRRHGLTVALSHTTTEPADDMADARLRLGKGAQNFEFDVEIKRSLVAEGLGAVVGMLRQRETTSGRPVLLVVGHISPRVAELCKNLGQAFVDSTGNAYVESPAFLLWVSGRKPAPGMEAGTAIEMRPMKTSSLKVMFALICKPQLAEEPYRQIAAAAGVALGTLPPAIEDLNLHGYLLATERRRQLLARRKLLDDWALLYARSLRPKQLLRFLVVNDLEQWRNWSLFDDAALWGGEPAASLQVGYLHPGMLTLYADKAPAHLILAQRLKTAEAPGKAAVLEVRKKFWGDVLDVDGVEGTVPPALVYADLLATGDARCIDAAQLVYDKYLARLFPAG